MKTTDHVAQQVLRKRPYLPTDAFAAIPAAPLRRSVQPDGRIRHRGPATDPRDAPQRILRIVTLDDGAVPRADPRAFHRRSAGRVPPDATWQDATLPLARLGIRHQNQGVLVHSESVKARTYKVEVVPSEALAKGPYVAETVPVSVEQQYVVVEV